MRVETDAGTLDIAVDGGAGPALLLLHEFALDKEIWAEFVPQLSSEARVVRCDLRGFGASSAPPGPYVVEALAGDLLDVVNRLGIERVVIVGHAYSVAIALTFYRMFSERVAALGMLGAAGEPPDETSVRELNALADAVEREGTAPLLAARLPAMLAPQTVRNAPAIVALVRAKMAGSNPTGVAANLRGMALRAGFDDLYGEIGVPVRIVAGAADTAWDVDAARAFAKRIPSAELDVVPRGRVPQLEAPVELHASLKRLIAEASRTP